MKKSVKEKCLVFVAVLAILAAMGCGSAEKSETQAEADGTVEQNKDANTEIEESGAEGFDEAEIQGEESVPEPTATPELIEIDERYEYRLYCSKMHTPEMEEIGPIIGFNLPSGEGWEINTSGSTGDFPTRYDIDLRNEVGAWAFYMTISCDEDYDLELLENEIGNPDGRFIINREELASLETPFGEAKIYGVTDGMRIEESSGNYEFYEKNGEIYEANGIKYVTSYSEVGEIEIGTHKVIFVGNPGLTGIILEEIIPQLFQLS